MQKMAQSSLFELGDVIVTEPAEGVYGVAVVLRLHEPEEGFSPHVRYWGDAVCFRSLSPYG